MTWPLAPGLARDVPADFGDPLLNMWILAWGAEHLPRVLTGAMTFAEFWNANIFHPELLTLGFSEHLFGQVLQILPLYHATDNVILCYNLLVLSNFALSGFAMFLLVRDITGSTSAAFLAGVAYAFTPFRFSHLPQVQVMSSQWIPFALLGFRRYIATGRLLPLASGSAALLMQNWSCGYYLLFYAPFVAIFVTHQMFTYGRLRSVRAWLHFAIAALVVFAGSWPFLAMYLATQQAHGLVRPFGEVVRFSANLHGYATAPEILRLWGSVLRALPRAEGEVFLGLMPITLGVVGVLTAAVDAARAEGAGVLPRWKRITIGALIALAIIVLASLLRLIFVGGFIARVGPLPLRATDGARLLLQLSVLAGAVLVLWPRARVWARTLLRSPAFLTALCVLLACWLSLGPTPMSGIRRITGMGLYQILYDYVPGFDGVRAPARFAMVAATFLAILAGIGAARIRSRFGATAVAALTVAILVESWAVPLPMNLTEPIAYPPPGRIHPAHSAPAVYQTLRSLPGAAVVAELPMGDPTWEVRYVYYSSVHWKRIINGYSGFFPWGYGWRVARLSRLPQFQPEARSALVEANVTHVILHRDGFASADADAIARWLDGSGARLIGRFDNDVLFELRR